MLLTEIFDVLKSIIESVIIDVFDETKINLVQNKRIKKIYMKEKEKILKEVHWLIDANENNTVVTSGEFYVFLKTDANKLIKQLLDINSDVIQEKSIEKRVENLVKLYYIKFENINPFERGLGADFLKNFFEILVRFKKNTFKILMEDDLIGLIKYELNNNELLKINENIQNIQMALNQFQTIYDHLEMNNQIDNINYEYNQEKEGKNTIQDFVDSFVRPMIFEEKTNVKSLKDVFVWPEYRTELLLREQDDLCEIVKYFLANNLRIYLYDKQIDKMKLEKNYNLLVVLGIGGMGKSSLLEKIAYQIKYHEIQVFAKNVYFAKFASMEYKNNNLINNIIEHLNIKKRMLQDSVIILDAFDEYIIDVKEKQNLLEIFCQDLQLLNCRCIMTSRENYINTESLQNAFVIKLLTFNTSKRECWLKKYNKKLSEEVVSSIVNYKDESDKSGEEFIGIPIIIYMVASNNIVISNYKSKFELYDSLFGKMGLWYKRMYDINHPALLTRNRMLYDFILSIAERMFHKNKLSVSKVEIETIINSVALREDLDHVKNWYGIITYFKKSKLNEIEFAHKSIYEYYIANKIYLQLNEIICEKDEIYRIEMLQKLFKQGLITKEILNFLEGFLEKDSQKCSEIEVKDLINICLNINIIFKNKYFLNFNEYYTYFSNSLNCLYKILEKKCSSEFVSIIDEKNIDSFGFFLRNQKYNYLFLNRLNLSNQNCSRFIFKDMDIRNSNMSSSDFSYCDFSRSNLQYCNLSKSNLYSAVLSDTKLHYADLRGCNLNNALIKKDGKQFKFTKININQVKYFWPEIMLIFDNFIIYSKEDILATAEELEFEFDKIRGYHL